MELRSNAMTFLWDFAGVRVARKCPLTVPMIFGKSPFGFDTIKAGRFTNSGGSFICFSDSSLRLDFIAGL